MTQGDFHNILATYTPTSSFGIRIDPFSGASSSHPGVDLAASAGTPIYSPNEMGVKTTVVDFGNSTSRGYWIILENDLSDGTVVYTEYMHMQNPVDPVAFARGKDVPLHTEIGKVGSTGHSTGPHLHYQEMISVNGSYIPVDPNLNWFGLSQGTPATKNAGTGMNIPGQTPDSTATYSKATASDGSVWLLYKNGDTFQCSNSFQQWTMPASDGSFTTISRPIESALTTKAIKGVSITLHFEQELLGTEPN